MSDDTGSIVRHFHKPARRLPLICHRSVALIGLALLIMLLESKMN